MGKSPVAALGLIILLISGAVLGEDNINQDTGGSIYVSTAKLLDSPVEDMKWLSTVDADGNTKAEKIVLVLSQGGVLYRSVDEGKTWDAQTEKLTANGATEIQSNEVEELYVSPADDQAIFLRGRKNVAWTSKDAGATFTRVDGYKFFSAKPHPRKAELLLAAQRTAGCSQTGTDCYNELYLSKDFGATWELIAKYVYDYSWGLAPNCYPEEAIFATIAKDQQGRQNFQYWSSGVDLVLTLNYFASNPRVLLEHANRFVFHNNFFYAATVSRDNTISLHVSRDCGNTFVATRFPYKLSTQGYTFVSASEEAVFIHVDHALPGGVDHLRGNVYGSDFTGASFTDVIKDNVRGSNGQADFHPVEGIDGVIIANVIDPADVGKSRQRTLTKISFDNGGQWHLLPKPTNEPSCDDCSLHLHGVSDRWAPLYSTKNAIGLLIGTGNVGHHLHDNDDEVNTYFSRDGGLSWTKVTSGKYIYDLGDHGGIVVAAKHGEAAHSLLYSWNEGQDWAEVKFKTHDIEVENIITEPGSTSSVFLIYGRQGDNGVIVQVDFRPLHTRQCSGADAPGSESSDYEEYTPSDGSSNGKCLLGQEVTYVRRKQLSQCFNGQTFERKKSINRCHCEYSDYECDYGYEGSVNDNGQLVCEKITGPNAPEVDHIFAGGLCLQRVSGIANPEVCTNYYYIPNGFRKVPGDMCIGGLQLAPELLTCGPSAGTVFGYIVLFLIIIAAIVGIIFLAKKRGWFKKVASTALTGFGGGGGGGEAEPSVFDRSLSGEGIKEKVIGAALFVVDGVKKILPKNGSAKYSRLDTREGEGVGGDFTLAEEEETEATEVQPAPLRPGSAKSAFSFDGGNGKLEVKLPLTPKKNGEGDKQGSKSSNGSDKKRRDLVFDEDEEDEEVGRQPKPAKKSDNLPRGELLEQFPPQRSERDTQRERIVDSLSDILAKSGP